MKLKQNKVFLFFLVIVSLFLLLRCEVYLYNLHNYGGFTKIKGFEKNKMKTFYTRSSVTRFVNLNANETIIFSPIFTDNNRCASSFDIYHLDNKAKRVVKKQTSIKARYICTALLPDNKIYIIAYEYKNCGAPFNVEKSDSVYIYDHLKDKLVRQQPVKINKNKKNEIYSIGFAAEIAANKTHILIGPIFSVPDKNWFSVIYNINTKKYKKAFDGGKMNGINPGKIYVLDDENFLIYGSKDYPQYYIKRYNAKEDRLYSVDIKEGNAFWQEGLHPSTFIWLKNGVFLFIPGSCGIKKKASVYLVTTRNDKLKGIKRIDYKSKEMSDYLSIRNVVPLNENEILFIGGNTPTGMISYVYSKQVYLLDIKKSTFTKLNDFPYKIYNQTLHTLDNNKVLMTDGYKCSFGICAGIFSRPFNEIYMYTK